jgi:hypothetical protein
MAVPNHADTLFITSTADERLERRMKGSVEGITTRPRLTAKGAKGEVLAAR